jgi:hypothetical protein
MRAEEKKRDLNFHRAVSRAVLSSAIQHPATLFPAAAAILASVQMVMMNPSKQGLAVAMVSGFLSFSSFVYHYVVKGEQTAAQFAREYQNKKEAEHVGQLNQLLSESRRSGFQEGSKEGEEFLEAYLKLTRYLKNVDHSGSDRVHRFLLLAEDCYRQGLKIFHDAVETHKLIFTFPVVALNDELTQWVEELATLEKRIEAGNTQLSVKKKALESRVRNHRLRIDTYQEKRNRLDQLMAELESLETALSTAYLEAVDLITGQTLKNISLDPAQRLEKAVYAAKRVEKRLAQMAQGNPEEDQIYKDAAKGG